MFSLGAEEGWLLPGLPLAFWVVGVAAGALAASLHGRPALGGAFRRLAYVAGASGGAAAAVGAAVALAGSVQGFAATRSADASSAARISATSAAVPISSGLDFPSLTRLTLAVDPLGAFFVFALGLVACAVCIYGIGYRPGHGAGDASRPVASGLLAAGCNAFLAAMLLVFLAQSVFTFLLAWEVMSLVSFFLVLYDHEEAAVRRAGYVYLVMTHAGTAFILGAFLLIAAHAGSFEFTGMRLALGSVTPGGNGSWRAVAFLMALIGFGTKAGLIPLHVWLPRAHPAAPTHVSALMSGIMVKTGIYGLVRIAWDFLGAGGSGDKSGAGLGLPAWAGGLLLAIGLVSAVLGVLYALMEHDLKRLLAYHTVENIGIIVIGLGASVLLAAMGAPAAAAVALGAALFHTLNHAVFKSLLFLGAGAVLQGAHTRDLEEMGGLIRRMPWTAASFLVGSAAISALPPLNGFASEWLTFQSLVALATQLPARAQNAWLAPAGIAAAAALGLTGALAAACFVKAFGGAFLALPRSRHAEGAQEVPASMRWAMATLAAACAVLGLAAGAVLSATQRIWDFLTQSAGAGPATALPAFRPSVGLGGWGGMAFPLAGPAEPRVAVSLVPAGVLGALLMAAALALAMRRMLSGGTRVRRAPTWACGIVLEPQMEYTPTSFAKPIRIVFSWAVQPFRQTEPEYAPASGPYFLSVMRYHAGTRPVIEREIYRRIELGLIGAAYRLRRLQTGSLRLYLAYLLGALVVLLVWGRSGG